MDEPEDAADRRNRRSPGRRAGARGRAEPVPEPRRSWLARFSRPDPPRASCNSDMEKAERDAILRQGVVLPETPRQRRELAALNEDLETIPLPGRKPLPHALAPLRPSAEAYLVATRGPLPYMLRLRRSSSWTSRARGALGEAWDALAADCDGDPAASGVSGRLVRTASASTT